MKHLEGRGSKGLVMSWPKVSCFLGGFILSITPALMEVL